MTQGESRVLRRLQRQIDEAVEELDAGSDWAVALNQISSDLGVSLFRPLSPLPSSPQPQPSQGLSRNQAAQPIR